MAAKSAPRSFESSLLRLDEIVSLLENGKTDLQASLAFYEEGIALLRNCQSLLDSAEQKIEILKGIDEEKKPVTESVPLEKFQSDSSRPGRKTGTGSGRKETASLLDDDEFELGK